MLDQQTGLRSLYLFSAGSSCLVYLGQCIAQLIGYAGINYSSPTLGTAVSTLFQLSLLYLQLYSGKLSIHWKKPSWRLRIRVIFLFWNVIITVVLSC
ncbi:hypothetical protein RchiOBHm_Chr4g0404791 [Rosa chinensis]|uniref:Uncharacterized protein n=1 Tax=Rosa chinensis TaxID=74649 RepID=A0A2P6QTW5_ROSCH|nr:hypothetical protein RchiOBHm_Chr4g0404791 [Rosa chinensis]